MKEIYKEIPDYEGLYEVSNLGNVRALDRYNVDKNGLRKFYPGKELSKEIATFKHTTYYRITLSKNGRTKRFQLHRLVALAFIPTEDTSLHVNHKDNCGTNNYVDNLEWCTHSENMAHAQKQGRLTSAQSKGGKTLGNKITSRIQDRLDNLLHTNVGKWYVKEYVGLIPNASNTRQAYSFNCVCECGYELVIDSTRLVREETLMCKSCERKQRMLKSLAEFVATLCATEFKTLTFTGNYVNSKPDKSELRYYKFEVLDTTTKSTKYISHYSVNKLLEDDDIV